MPQFDSQFSETLLELWEAEFPLQVKQVRAEAGKERFARIVDNAAAAAAKHLIDSLAEEKTFSVLEAFEIAYCLVTPTFLLKECGTRNVKEPAFELKSRLDIVLEGPVALDFGESGSEKPIEIDTLLSPELKSLFMSVPNCPICGVEGKIGNAPHH